jgi:hypothetical protein
MYSSPLEQLMSKVHQQPQTGCWLWTGARARNYGHLRIGGRCGRHVYAHRLSFELHKGPIGKGQLVCHSCDTPTCVNPEHLFLGTALDNSRDKYRKGRQGCGKGPGLSRLTDAETADLINEGLRGIGYSTLAKRFGVGRRSVASLMAAAKVVLRLRDSQFLASGAV